MFATWTDTAYWTLLGHAATILGFLLALAALAHMLRQQRSPSRTVAWFLAIVLLPYVSVPLYVMLGGRKMRRLADSKSNIGLDHDPHEAPAITEVDILMRSYGLPGATRGNTIKLCHDGQDAYAQLIKLIQRAERQIHITTFILHPDPVGREVLAQLTLKAEQGVKVRLLLDGVGCMQLKRSAYAPLLAAGGEVAIFMPVFRRPWQGRTNLRNHRKIVVVDGQWALSGGMNIADEYMGPEDNPERWHDLSFVLTGPAVRHYEEIFHMDWNFASASKLERSVPPNDIADEPGEACVQVIPSGPDLPQDTIYDAILTAAFEANERIWIATPYFIPDDALMRAFSVAIRRGVDLRILLPKRSNHLLADWARGTYLRELQQAGGKIMKYMPAMLHAKAMIVDDRMAMIGSANVDLRSLLLNYEVSAMIYTKDDMVPLERWFQARFADSVEGADPVGPIRDIGEGVVRMLAPLM